MAVISCPLCKNMDCFQSRAKTAESSCECIDPTSLPSQLPVDVVRTSCVNDWPPCLGLISYFVKFVTSLSFPRFWIYERYLSVLVVQKTKPNKLISYHYSREQESDLWQLESLYENEPKAIIYRKDVVISFSLFLLRLSSGLG